MTTERKDLEQFQADLQTFGEALGEAAKPFIEIAEKFHTELMKLPEYRLYLAAVQAKREYADEYDEPILTYNTNVRGFRAYKFTETNGYNCSIQESSSANEDKIWLGIDTDRHGERITIDGSNARMHLNRAQVAALLPLLHHFVEHGTLPEPDDEVSE